jgi:hypothetical protein
MLTTANRPVIAYTSSLMILAAFIGACIALYHHTVTTREILINGAHFSSPSPFSLDNIEEKGIIEQFSSLDGGFTAFSFGLEADEPVVGSSIETSSELVEDQLHNTYIPKANEFSRLGRHHYHIVGYI